MSVDFPYSLIVTGHPRSGTSTMMRMLGLGGVEMVYSEDSSKVDNYIGNPYGIYEQGDILTWLPASLPSDTNGKVTKVIAPYIHYFPYHKVDRPVKLIFMVRDLQDIMSSLLEIRVVWKYTPEQILASAYTYIQAADLETMYINFNDMIKYPKTTALRIEEYMGVDLDVDTMATAVDKNVRKKVREKIDAPLITFQFDENKVFHNDI